MEMHKVALFSKNEPTENEYVDDSGDDLEEMREDEFKSLQRLRILFLGPSQMKTWHNHGLCTHIYKMCHAYQGQKFLIRGGGKGASKWQELWEREGRNVAS